ncbi:MAG: hypothetical protein M1830_002322 [Pleopsidium flavum]|nr:MAG: hypothetical protein M1830_002322 [Pleopsidium flavum]
MAAAISVMIDPTKAAKYPVKLGEGLQVRKGTTSRLYSSIKYNHKPSGLAQSRTTVLAPSETAAGIYDLNIANQLGSTSAYHYKGSRSSSNSFALIYDPTIQVWALERVDTDFGFNLTSTPSNADAKEIAAKYPQLELGFVEGASDGEDLFADGDDNGDGDEENPYDYRHFIKRRRTSSPDAVEVPTISRASPPTDRRTSRAKPKPRPKRAKTPPKDEDADNEDSDDGGLTIEMDPDTKPRRLGAELVRPSSAAPISLRSAASSVSPHGEKESESESESDEDVEALQLPSPAAAPTPGDAEDELEAELAQALESQEGGGEVVQDRRRDESSSESEEE